MKNKARRRRLQLQPRHKKDYIEAQVAKVVATAIKANPDPFVHLHQVKGHREGISILDQITHAETPGKVMDIMTVLLDPSCTADKRTRKRWRAAGEARIEELRQIQAVRSIIIPK